MTRPLKKFYFFCGCCLAQKKCFFSLIVLLISSPYTSNAEEEIYVAGKIGSYTFAQDMYDAGMRTGVDTQVVCGYRFSSNWVFELGGGYFHNSEPGSKGDIRGYPLFVGVKKGFLWDKIEFFTGINGGLSYAKFKGCSINGPEEDNGSDIILYGELIGGLRYPIPGGMFISLEARLRKTSEARFNNETVNLDGFILSVSYGFSL